MIALCLLATAVVGCNRYTVSINNQEIYTPPQPFDETLIADGPLSDCVEQTIKDQRVSDLKDLEILNCSHAGISSLEGLSKYSRLTQVSLKQNTISDVDELLKLTRLEYIDISENPNLTCRHIYQLRAAEIKQVHSNLSCK